MKNRENHRILYALSALLLASIVMLTSVACGESTECIDIGLEAAGILSEMVQSKEYVSIFLPNVKAQELLDSMFNTGDYDAPVAVYRLKLTDPRELIKIQLPEAQRKWIDSLSPVLQEQFYARIQGINTMSSMINATGGAEVLALTGILQVQLKNSVLEYEEPEYYLFVFEKGVPVVVTYGWHQASGTFLTLQKSATESAEALQAALQIFGVEAIPMAIR